MHKACLTLTQLREQFFALDNDHYKTAPIGDTTLVFLRGTHILPNLLAFYGYNISVSLTGLDDDDPTHYTVDAVVKASTLGHYCLKFMGTAVSMTSLQFNGCRISMNVSPFFTTSDFVVVDYVIFIDTLLSAGTVGSARVKNTNVTARVTNTNVTARVTNTNVTITAAAPANYCYTTADVSLFFFVSIRTNLANISFTSENSACASHITLVLVDGGCMDISGVTFYGSGKHIALIDAVLTVSQNARFDNGTLAIRAQRSTVHLAGNVTFRRGTPSILAQDSTVSATGSIRLENGNPAIQAQNSSVHLTGNTMFANCDIAIQTINSPVTLAGNTSFFNNTAYQGGAMSLSDSPVTIAYNAHVVFQDNRADYVGGAIYSTGNDIVNYISVGLRVDSCQILFGANSTVEFINNTAVSGGSAMYGISESTLVCGERSMENQYDNLYQTVSIQPDDFSAVSSDPLTCLHLSR